MPLYMTVEKRQLVRPQKGGELGGVGSDFT